MLAELSKDKFKILIFICQSQNKIPFELEIAAQNFGSQLEWIKIDGNGTNALDFYIDCYLGEIY
jgi:hypothetical protein